MRALVVAIGVMGAAASAPAATPAATREIREYRVPMRDGLSLHTVVVGYKDGRPAPAMLVRTAFGAAGRAKMFASGRMPPPNESELELVFVYQDVRGKFGSQGTYRTNRLASGKLAPSETDDTTDAWDTVAWIAKTLPGAKDRVGLIGASLDGYYAAAALLNPHPSIRAAVLEQPLIDGWRGDDWFHNGAFRQVTFDFLSLQYAGPEFGAPFERKLDDDFKEFLAAGSAADFARSRKLDATPMWKDLVAHPAYDGHWKNLALDRRLAQRASTVPTLWVQALWDQEDAYGAVHGFLAARKRATAPQYLVAGPWTHRAPRFDGSELGPVALGEDTAETYRRDVLLPFLREHLLKAGKANLAPIRAYDVGTRSWRTIDAIRELQKHASPGYTGLYVGPSHTLTWAPPREHAAFDGFTSDPASPVPFATRPIELLGDVWESWITADQSAFASRADVLTYRSPLLDAPVTVAGFPAVELHASTSGTDADWIVKLIDAVPADPKVPGSHEYLLPIAMEIFRGRYRTGLDAPKALTAGAAHVFRFDLPLVNHTFARGHRLAVQIQSTWFPLYDRNPQRFVPNVLEAKAADYVAAEHRVFRQSNAASVIWLPRS
jgi:putative CocE/NonD family hydrolase